MLKVFSAVVDVDEQLGGFASYKALASAVYGASTPTAAQLSSVARASRRLEQLGLVNIYAWRDDLRRKLVAPSPWLNLAMGMLDGGLRDENMSLLANLAQMIRDLQHLAEMGVLKVESEGGTQVDPRARELTLDGRLITADFPARRSE